jgi:hypothetical protein
MFGAYGLAAMYGYRDLSAPDHCYSELFKFPGAFGRTVAFSYAVYACSVHYDGSQRQPSLSSQVIVSPSPATPVVP